MLSRHEGQKQTVLQWTYLKYRRYSYLLNQPVNTCKFVALAVPTDRVYHETLADKKNYRRTSPDDQRGLDE